MSFLLDIVTKICDLTVEPIYREVEYTFNYRSNIDKLRIDVQHLTDNRNGLQQRIHQAERNGEVILVPVGQWMTEADGIRERADRILGDEEGHARASCSWGSFPNLFLRHKLSKEANRMASSVFDIRSRCHFDPVSCCPILLSNVGNNDYEYEDFLSRKATMDNVMESLKDPNISMIGVYGMPGIGKTMFAKEASQKAMDQMLFDQSILVAVSEVPNLEKIQQEIAEKLGLELKETILSPRADRLRHRLRSEKKMLIILDDVWKKLKLHDIGISFGSDQKGCKILLTSRFENLVCNDMGAVGFRLDLLSDYEATELFYNRAGYSVRGQELQHIAEKIIKKCARLPIAIVVVAAALKNQELPLWEVALLRLQKSIPMSIVGMDEEVDKSIRLSYDFLASKEARDLLLLCSIHQEDENINVQDLVVYCMGLDLFPGISKLKDARNTVYSLVHYLKACCLLLEGKSFVESESFVKVHDVIRHVCLSIASQDKRMHFIRDVDELKDCIRRNELMKSVAISLPSVNVNQFPKRLECSQLKLLLIRHRDHIRIGSKGRLDEQFFEEMKELRVLSLYRVEVKLTCLSQLQNLQTLCLRLCNVGDISPIGELQKLEILDLAYSNILEVPKEIGQLTLLRSLVLDGCNEIDHVEPHVISSLINLEQLNMKRSFSRWNAEGIHGEISNASPVELNDLDQLTTLNVHIHDVSSLPRIWIKTNLERYKIIIGDWGDSRDGPYVYSFWNFHGNKVSTTSKMLKLKLEKSDMVKDHGIENLMKSAKELSLDGLGDVNDVLELDKDGFPQLEHFVFQNNGSARYIINLSDPCSAFLNLKSMFLENMMNLEKICQGKLIARSFGKLKKVSVKKCHRITRLFSFSIAKQFEEIEVWDCQALEEIVACHESEYESSNANNEALNETKFGQLKNLKLGGLPKVTRFFWPEGETISMSERGEGLLNEKGIFPKLAHMELSGLKVGMLWQDKVHGASIMQNLTKLMVDKCDVLNSLLSYDVVEGLVLLEHLEVKYCNALKEVIVVKTPCEKMLLPKLQTLVLCNLQKLSRFCSKCYIEYPSLKVLKIKECPQLGDLALIGELNNLEELDFSDCSSIVELPQGIERLTQLKKLKLRNCSSLKAIKPIILSKLIHLQELDMIMSPVTWEAEGVLSGEGSNASLAELKILPQLTTLSLSLPDVSIVPKDLFSEKLDRYCIDIGASSTYSLPYYSSRNFLGLKLKKTELVRDIGLQVLLKCCRGLHLDGFEDENDFFYNLEYKELFPQLIEVKVASCARFKHLFPYPFSGKIELTFLTVEDCERMEAIVTHERDQDHDYQHPNDRNFNKIEHSYLQILTLKNLPRLEKFYSKVKTSVISHPRDHEPYDEEEFEIFLPFFGRNVHMPELRRLEMELLRCKQIWHCQPLSNFEKLIELKVLRCHHLKSLMSYSMATSLVSLRHLEVCNCKKMEEVISTLESGNEGSVDLISFRKVQKLIIKDLPKLRRFSAANGVMCPYLSRLTMIDCFNLMAFVNISTHVPAKYTFFGGKVIFPSLVYLKVNHREILNEIFNLEGESSVNSFGMLEGLCLGSVLPFEVVQRFQNLRQLYLFGFASEKLFPPQELRAAEENENILPHLKTLELRELPKLLHMFDEDVHLTKAFSNLEIVDIIRCYQLKSFIPPSMSFQYYLKTLRVTECHGLKNLFASSVVKGLVNLKEMSIYGCEGMMEIVGKDEVELVSEIVFQQLETLALHNLPNLKCFYCENSTLTFPNLETLLVSQCPQMQTFSHGIVNSPILDKVITGYDWNYNEVWEGEMTISKHFKGFKYNEVKEECWEHNINDTIRKIFEQSWAFLGKLFDDQSENASGD